MENSSAHGGMLIMPRKVGLFWHRERWRVVEGATYLEPMLARFGEDPNSVFFKTKSEDCRVC